MAEISLRISRYAQDLAVLDENKSSEPLNHIITSSSMQSKIIESMEMAF